MKNSRKRSSVLAINAMFLALTIIFVYVPLPGLVTSSVLMLLPTIVISQIFGLGSALFQGLMLGVLLFIKGFGYVTAPTDITLRNPLISIMPRIIVALVIYLLSRLGDKIQLAYSKKNDKKQINNFKAKKTTLEYFTSTVISFIGALLNAVIVLTMFYVFYKGNKIENFPEVTFDFVFGIFAAVSTFEMLTTLLSAPPIVIASKKALDRIMNKG